MLRTALTALLFLIHSGCVVSQLTWSNTLSEVLTNQGVPENTTVGTELGTISVTGSQGAARYSSNSSVIAVDQASGVVTLQQPLDYATTSSFVVQFTAEDSANPNVSISTLVTVNVVSVSNRAPSFDVDHYTTSVAASLAVGSTIYQKILVTDSDDGPAGDVTVSCHNTSDSDEACAKFSVRLAPATGSPDSYRVSVILGSSLDYTAKNVYTMIILAVDGGNPPMSSSATLTINVDDPQSRIPTFLNAPISFFVREREPSTTELASVLATITSDTTIPLLMEITTDVLGYFSLSNTTRSNINLQFFEAKIRSNGIITRPVVRDRFGGRRYTFVVTAFAIFNGQKTQVSNSTNVTAVIQDPNDSPPVFQLSTATATVNEGIGRGSLVPGLNMLVTDRDSVESAFFRLSVTSKPSPEDGIFGVIPQYGQSSVSASLVVWKPKFLSFVDEARRSYTVTVTATNNKTVEKLSSQAQVRINVVAANNPPFFQQRSYLATVRDDQDVGSVVINNIRATDEDTGLYGKITYSVVSGESSYISIDSDTAVVRLARQLNYAELNKTLEYVLQATDGANASTTATLTIDVLDSRAQGPRFDQNQYNAFVPELSNTLVPAIRIFATPLRRDVVLSYWIVDGNHDDLFELDPDTGDFTMRHGVDINDTPDRQGYFDVTVEARESGTTPTSSNVTVRIDVRDSNNHIPVFTNTNYSATIPETSPPGTTVVRLNATDGDIQQNALVTFYVGPGGRDNFVIDPDDGSLRVSPNSRLVVDYPPTYYNITVYAVDHGSPQKTATTTIYVVVEGSQRPVFNSHNYIFAVRDNAPVNHSVGVVTARLTALNSDNSAITYSVLPGSVRAVNRFNQPVTSATTTHDYTNMFGVLPSSGSVVVSGPVSWNYVAISYFQVEANNTQASYNVEKTDVANVTVYLIPVPDSPIQFIPPLGNNRTIVVYVKEERPLGTPVYNPVVRDVDNPATQFHFRLNSSVDGYLAVDPDTGVVTVSGRLDYETFPDPKQISSVLTVSEPGVANKSVNATLVVIIEDINDNTPIFTPDKYNFWVYDDAKVGHVIGDVNATDADCCQFGLIQYAIINDVDDYFTIDPTTGVISVDNPLDQLGTVTVIVTATDNWNGTRDIRRVDTVAVTISVLDSDTSGIVFLGTPYSFYTVDTVPANHTIGSVTAFDLQIGGIANITYAIVSDNNSYLFTIDPTTGEIRTGQPLTGLSRPNSYLVNVTAEADGPPRINSTIVAIRIYDQKAGNYKPFFIRPDEDGKQFPFDKFEPEVYITTVFGGYVVRPNVTGVTYHFLVNGVPVTQSNNGRFTIDPLSGRITFDGSGLTAKGFNSSFLTLVVRDDDSPPQQSDPRVILVVVNDPGFERCPSYESPRVIRVQENASVGQNVSYIKACNPDTGSTIYYYLIDGNATSPSTGNPMFILRPEDGGQGASIFTVSTLDISDGLFYRISVIASNEPLNATQIAGWNGTRQNLDVRIVDVDNNGPTFDSQLPGACGGIGKAVERGVVDFPAEQELIVTMFAGDCDVVDENRQVTYSLSDIQFEFIDPDRGYELDSDAEDLVSQAFTINSTGAVTPHLTSYRPYSFGRFVLTVVATDPSGRTDTSELKLYVVKESDELRYTFNARPVYVRPTSDDFLNHLEEAASKAADSDSVIVTGSGVHYHINGSKTSCFGWRQFIDRPYLDRSHSDLCFYAIKDGEVVNDETKGDLFSDVNTTAQCSAASSCPTDAVSRCYPPLTTHEWSGYWWVWWLLIALALLIFLLALILTIIICCLGLSYHRRHISQMYFSLDEPRGGAVPVSEYEYQEASHQLS